MATTTRKNFALSIADALFAGCAGSTARIVTTYGDVRRSARSLDRRLFTSLSTVVVDKQRNGAGVSA
jgi:hypothetical protein